MTFFATTDYDGKRGFDEIFSYIGSMKDILILLYTFFFRMMRFADKSLQIANSKLLFVKPNMCANNRLIIEHAVVKRTAVNVHGERNKIIIKGNIGTSEIRVSGQNNVVEIAKDCGIDHSVIVVNGVDCKVIIGEKTSIGSMYAVCMGKNNYISIGEDCLFSTDIDIWATDSHPIYNEKGEVCNPSKPIKIGNHVWIGKCAKILKGVSVEDNGIIGMNAMVTRDVPANSIIVGNKGRIIKTGITWGKTFIRE